MAVMEQMYKENLYCEGISQREMERDSWYMCKKPTEQFEDYA